MKSQDTDAPHVKTQRCDACRIVAAAFDVAFTVAEERILADADDNNADGELTDAQAVAVVKHLCRAATFADVVGFSADSVTVGGGGASAPSWRLAWPGLETWRLWGRVRYEVGGAGEAARDAENWPVRMEQHCK